MNSKNKFALPHVLMASGLVVCILSGCANLLFSPVPASVPIRLDQAGVVADFEFKVNKSFIYWYSMEFFFPKDNQLERARVRNLLGEPNLDKMGQPLKPGVPTPIHLSIFAVCKTGKQVEVYSQDVNPLLTSWGGDSFGKNIGFSVLTPGMYRARIVNKRASPEFSSIPITFNMGMSAKTSFDPSTVLKSDDPCEG